MAAKTTLNAKNLEALGAERLSELLIEISTGSAAHKRRLRLELAGAQSTAEVAREVRKRLSSIDRSKTVIDWRKIKALKSDLETQRTMISGTIAAGDADEAMDLLWRFLELAGSIFARCDDSNGVIIGSFHAACVDLGAIAPGVSHRKRLAEEVFAAIKRNEYGECDPLIPALAPALGQGRAGAAEKPAGRMAAEDIEVPTERVRVGWGMMAPFTPTRSRTATGTPPFASRCEQIADAEGDVDGFVRQQSETSQTVPAIAAEIAASAACGRAGGGSARGPRQGTADRTPGAGYRVAAAARRDAGGARAGSGGAGFSLAVFRAGPERRTPQGVYQAPAGFRRYRG